MSMTVLACTILDDTFTVGLRLKKVLFFFIFTDVRKVDDRIEYLVKQKDQMPCTVVPSVLAFSRWPKLVLKFLERQVRMTRDEQTDQNVNSQLTEVSNPIGNPISIKCQCFILIFRKIHYKIYSTKCLIFFIMQILRMQELA